MRFSAIAATLVFGTIAASTASAQTAHKRAAGDTLRFLQTSKMTQAMEGGPMGSINQDMNTTTRIVLAFGAGDTITAWMDSASATGSSPAGDIAPDMSAMLNRKQVATLSPAGDLKILQKADLLPPELAGMAGLVPETLHGLELEVPKEALRKGVTWTDTIDTKSDSASASKMATRGTMRYEVVGDSTIAGRPVAVLDASGTSDIDLDMVVGDGSMNVKGKMTSTSKGRVYYSPALGLILKRAVVTDTKGTQELSGAMSMSFAVTQRNDEQTAIIE